MGSQVTNPSQFRGNDAKLESISVLRSQCRNHFKVNPHNIHDLGQLSRVKRPQKNIGETSLPDDDHVGYNSHRNE